MQVMQTHRAVDLLQRKVRIASQSIRSGYAWKGVKTTFRIRTTIAREAENAVDLRLK